MNINNLYEHEFMKHLRVLLQDQLFIMIESCPERGIRKKDDYIETTSAEYVRTVFEKFSNLMNTIEQLEYIPIFIQRFPLQKFYNENGINNENYIKYHLENHFLKVSSILDQSIILVNEVHNLGIPTRRTSLSQLKENKHTKDAPSINVLKAFEKGVQGIKSMRNKITHRGEFNDYELNELSKNNFFNKISDKTDGKLNLLNYSKLEMNNVVKNKLEFLEKNNKEIVRIIYLLFEALEVEFKYKLEEIN